MISSAVFFCIVLVVLLVVVTGMPPISVVASVRGKKYDIADVETVEEFTSKIESIAGLEAGQQSVLFRGKVLNASERLEELGVSNGDVLMVVKGRKQREVKSAGEVEDEINGASGADALSNLSPEEYKKAMENASPEDMQKAMKAMDNLLDSDFVDEYFADEERLENARQQMLANLDQYEQMMPGFREQAQSIASDPVKWREAMLQAKEQISKLKEQRDSMRTGKGAPTTQENSVDDISEDDL